MANDITDFLKEYALIEYKEKELNFFQIAGFPHYENVSSNILTYFFKNNIVLKAFLECIPVEFDESKDYIEKIFRKEVTENGKSLDLLIYTNNYIIGIENKIDAGLYNPIEDFYNHLAEIAKTEDKKLLLIVLSKKVVAYNEKYYNILYKGFSSQIKKYYSKLLNDLGYKYFLFLSEFIEFIEDIEV